MKNGKVVQAPTYANQTPGPPDALLERLATFYELVLPTQADNLAEQVSNICRASSDNRGNIKILHATPL
jgi:hypothetical protein